MLDILHGWFTVLLVLVQCELVVGYFMVWAYVSKTFGKYSKVSDTHTKFNMKQYDCPRSDQESFLFFVSLSKTQ